MRGLRERATGAIAVAVALMSASCDGSSSPSKPPQEPTRPNILVVMTDDQRADGTMGVMPATRTLMARGGTVFTSAFATTPFCCPSRASVFSGRYAHNHRVLVNVEGRPNLLDQRSTVQYHLHEDGYRTGIFGKYLNGWDLERDPPYFDEWAIFDASETGYSGGVWNVDGETRRVGAYSTTYLQRKAVDFIRSGDGSRPWLLFVTTAAPHEPFSPARKYEGAQVPQWEITPAITETDRTDKPPFLRVRDLRLDVSRHAHDQQLRTLMSVDDLVARVGEVLEDAGQDENTLVFFLSDNGYLWGEHGVGKKMLPYTPSISIPMMMRWPGRVDAGMRDDRLAATIDVAPTILDAAGVEPRSGTLDGRSLLETWDREHLLLEFWAAFQRPTWAGIRTHSFLFAEYYERDGETLTFQEYYDLEDDPWELDNLLVSRGPNEVEVKTLSEQLATARTCAGESCP